jgi:hypothetical protein
MAATRWLGGLRGSLSRRDGQGHGGSREGEQAARRPAQWLVVAGRLSTACPSGVSGSGERGTGAAVRSVG